MVRTNQALLSLRGFEGRDCPALQFPAKDANITRRLDAKTNPLPADLNQSNGDRVTNTDRLSELPAED